jgi:ubiquinone/menaquinone biosynthesis C-methylase UbiE
MSKSETQDLQVQLGKAAKAFDDTDDYHVIQTQYTVESAEYLLKQVGILSNDNKVKAQNASPVTVVELGSGTGLFTLSALEALRGKGRVRYVATDPLECMKKAFAKYLPDVEFIICKAENMREFIELYLILN